MTGRVFVFVAVAVLAVCIATPHDSTAGQQSMLRGRITQAQDPNLPVPRARVSIELPSGGIAVAHADENGRYEVPVPLQSAVMIAVTKSSYLRATFRHTSRSGPAAGRAQPSDSTQSLDVQLVKAGAISGRVVDSSGQPIMGAGVRAWRTTGPPGGNRAIGIPAVSNDLGEFRLAGLTAGAYELSAFFDFEARAQLRENDVDRVPPTGPPPEVRGTIQVLAEPVVVDVPVGGDVSVTLRQQQGATFGMQPQGNGVIAGRILDNVGEPIEGARVRLWRAPPTGSGLLTQKGPAAVTDDLGRYRLFYIPIGTYVVEALAPADAAADPTLPVYYPGTHLVSEAIPISIQQTREFPAVDAFYAPRPLSRVHGVVTPSTDRPRTGRVALVRSGAAGELRLPARSVVMADDGSFEFTNVVPGEYALSATVDALPGQATTDTARSEFGVLQVSVGETPGGPLRLATLPTMTLRGRVEVEPAQERTTIPRVTLRARAVDPELAPDTPDQGVARSQVQQDGTFEITGLVGPVRLTLESPGRNWWMKSIRTPATQTIDDPIDVTAAPDIVVVLSNASGVLAGRVTLPPNAGVASIALVIFPADERHWSGAADPAAGAANGSLQFERPRQDGSFSLRPMLPGTYAVVALSGMTQYPDRSDPLTLMTLLSPLATRVKVPEAGTTSIDIALKEMPR